MPYRAYFLILFLSISGYSKAQEIVQISDTTIGKRITVYALNTADTLVNIFFKVEAEGYRKSAERPVIIDLPPEKKTKLATLVKLDPTAPDYQYILVVNDKKPGDINIAKDRDYVADIEPLLEGKLVVFGHPDCDRCKLLEAGLSERKITYRSFNVDQDSKLYEQFLAFLDKESEKKPIIRLPFVWNKDHLMPQDVPTGILLEMLSSD